MFGVDDALIGAIGGGLLSTAGQLYANRQNLKYQKQVNDTNWQIAALNNATQIDMANTAHRREVEDLRAAGLNPILSSGGSGLSTPSLAGASMHSASVDNPLEGLANSAKAVGKILGRQYQAETDIKEADAKYAKADAEIRRNEVFAEGYRAENDAMKALAENQALKESGIEFHENKKDGTLVAYVDPTSKYYKEIKEGVMSEAKMKANENFRSWLNLGLGGANSAAGLIRVLRTGRRR